MHKATTMANNAVRNILKFVFFTQDRVGKDRRTFKIFKFRTMYHGAEFDKKHYETLNEVDGPVFKIRNDPRYTRVGRWLALTGLDELPQVVNVLRGEMALVGPRPFPVDEEKKIPKRWRAIRRSVKPGITSSWVVHGGHDACTFEQWMELDLADIRRKGAVHDSVILTRTLWIVLKNAARLTHSAAFRIFGH